MSASTVINNTVVPGTCCLYWYQQSTLLHAPSKVACRYGFHRFVVDLGLSKYYFFKRSEIRNRKNENDD